MTELIKPKQTWKDDVDNIAVVEHSQEIPDSFLDGLKEERLASTKPARDFHKVASIPTAVVEKWMREGFNLFDENITASEIVRKLQSEDLGAFLATTKRI